MIVTTKDLYLYSTAVQNSGITQEQIDNYEIELFNFLFTPDKAEEFIDYVVTHKECVIAPPAATPADNPFGGSLTEGVTICTYEELTTLINGNESWYRGMKPIICWYIAGKIMSYTILVGRQSTTVQGTYSIKDVAQQAQLTRVQANNIAIEGRKQEFQIIRFLSKPGNNPLNLKIINLFSPVKYMVQESGQNWMANKGAGASLYGSGWGSGWGWGGGWR